MKQAIVYQFLNTDTIVIGARKKQICSTFFFVHHGAVLVRLGKEEIPVLKGQSFWLPIDCLSAMTILQGSQISLFNFSVRTNVPLPKYAGFIAHHPLVSGIIASLECKVMNESDHFKDAYERLLRCLRDHLSLVHPICQYDEQLCALILDIERIKQGQSLTKTGSETLNSYGISEEEIIEQLIVRDWIKKRKSGQSIEKIAISASLGESEVLEKMKKIAGFT